MSKEKDYDPAVLRAVGNMLAGTDKWTDPQQRELYVDKAIMTAMMVRKKLRKIAEAEHA